MASATATASPGADRLPRAAEGILRRLGDARLGGALLLLTAVANAAAAVLPAGARLLDAPAYAILLGLVALSGVAAVAVRAPATWREWRRPGPVVPGPGALVATVTLAGSRDPDDLAAALRAAGYHARVDRGRRRWAVHGVRRGWTRFAAHGSHLAVVVVVLGAAIGAAYGSEATFSLFSGDQALLDAPRPGFSSAVRLEAFDAAFAADGRPQRLDTEVTFLRGGEAVERRMLRVNEPGSFDGYLVHPWTYGPAARVRVATLGGGALLDAPIPLDAVSDGRPVGSTALPTAGVTLGLALTDAAANELGVTVLGADGVVDRARLRPGEEARVGDLVVRLERFDAWVTFLSRRDPGLAVLFGGALLLCLSLAVGLWLPRRRVTLRPAGTAIGVTLRGERFDRPADELRRLVAAIGGGAG